MFISVTRLRVRSLRYLPAFLWKTRYAEKQARQAEGFLGGKLLVDKRSTYWTLTTWESEKSMKAYRGAGAHATVMPKLAHWCDEAAYAHWEDAGTAIPTWPEAHQRLLTIGRLSRVEHPSPAHEARLFAPPRLKPHIGGDLKPKS